MLAPGSNGETLLAGYRRARVAWAHITAAPAREIAAVSHYGLISLILLSLRDDSRWRICARDLGNGGVTIIEKATIQG
jgi:broad specificity phosphatase PhoE